ncbi:MAG: hypothetical protein HY702_04730 [Gemmatimonadetes bacterium]|nr:hypothetical protein [Gemmatimonadota bacterium]
MVLVELGLTLTFGALAGAVAYAAWQRWRRLRRLRSRETGWLSDAMVSQILARGEVEGPDPPLNLKEIGREEDLFWAESWDEPEPYQD